MSSFASSKLPTFEGIATQLTNWTNMLSQIQALLIDAEDKQLTDPAVNLWLDDLQDLAYDLDDLVDEFATEALRQSLKAKTPQASSSKVWNPIPNFKPKDVTFNFKTRSKIEEINTRLRTSFDRSSQLNLVKIVGTNTPTKTWQRPESTSLLYEPRVYGREVDQGKIIELLVGGGESSHNKVDVIPIVGMGGTGKTTLAQMVYNDETVKNHFDLNAWVCVSDEFDIMRITKAIYDSVTSRTCSFNNLDQAQVQLKQALTGKKFLIVLDDVWNENDNAWNVLKTPFNDGAQGSKVVVTTRIRNVATMMATVELHDVGLLSDDDCWSLFAQHAFENRSIDANPNLVSIGRKIVEKCKGLPLAAKTLGGLLRNKEQDEEWIDVLCSEIWDLPPTQSDILPALRLSYHNLPSHLMQCFAYCSIIPNDYEFEEEELIFLWMAEGLIQQQREKQMEDVGGEYFRELLSRSFFQPSSISKSSKFVMHDLIHDLAQAVARDTCFRLEDKLNNQEQCKNLHRARHLSYMQDYFHGLKTFEILHETKHLRSFLPFSLKKMSGYSTTKFYFDLLPKLPCLRVLSLSRYHINEVPNSIGDLKLLRFLNLSYTPITRLPESLETLYNLQTLMLRGCGYLKKFPRYMENLIDLRHLDLTDIDSLEEMPLGIGKLTGLQTLSKFIVSTGSQISELGNLIHLRGTLSISGLQNVVDPLDARGAKLNGSLDVLSMEWSKNSNDLRNERVETEVLNMLQPHKNLTSLHIKCYFGTRFSIWIEDPLFSRMVCLRLENCENCTSLPALGRLPSLNELYIEGMSAIKHVGLEFYGQGVSNPFPLLERLSFVNMPEWVDWHAFGVNEGVKPFTHVNELSIQKCPKLLGMLPNYLPSLRSLRIKECPQLLLKERNTLESTSLTSLGMEDGSIPDPLCSPSVANEVMLTNAMSKHLRSVTYLSIENIEKLPFLPKWFTLWQNEVRLQNCFPAFQHLVIKCCHELVSLFEEEKDDENKWRQQKQQHQEMPCMVSLDFLEIYNCEKLEKLPWGQFTFTSLGELRIKRCPSLVSFPETGFPSTLRKLVVDECKTLKSLSGWIMQNDNNNNLEVLEVTGCPSLTCLGWVPTTLKHLKIWWCEKLEQLLVEEAMKIEYPLLESVDIWHCQSLKYLPDGWFPLTSLQQLAINSCPAGGGIISYFIDEGNFLTNLTSLSISNIKTSKPPSEWNFHKFSSLEELRIGGAVIVREEYLEVSSFPMDGMLLPCSLIKLCIWGFSNLESLSSNGFQNLRLLESLFIGDCPRLSFPEQGLPPFLSHLCIYECPIVKQQCETDEYRPLIAHIRCIEIDGRSMFDLE